MKRETINTFSDGMSLDLNPLGTPAKTLTNCLNGTLTTYNGNELTLQNDMGNARVGTSHLPHGYVPVGMKEYGGIIYVASYNPETGKGQLGCFPSPQLIYISEAAQTAFEVNIQDIFLFPLKETNGYPIIKFTEYKEEVFKDSISLEPKVFNSGDLFIIKTNEAISDELREAIDANIISIKLFVVPTDGGSPQEVTTLFTYNEYSNNWKKPLWIYLNDGNGRYRTKNNIDGDPIENALPFETILSKYREFLQSYRGPQGTLEIVLEFNTFSSFDLYREYTKSGDDFTVEFIGEATPEEVDTTKLLPFAIYGNINKTLHNTSAIDNKGESIDNFIVKTASYDIKNNETLYYDLMPASPYGILKLDNNSFIKSGELNKLNILNSHNQLTNWNFEINSDNAIISWTYTTFKDDPEIDYMQFVFIPLDTVMLQGGLTKHQLDLFLPINSKPYKINKLYYSGDFEDIIDFLEYNLELSYIYLCRLDVIYKNGVIVNGLSYKLLYTGTFFNNKKLSEYNNSNRPLIKGKAEIQVELSYKILSFNYTILTENENGVIISELKDIVDANDIMFLADNEKYYNKVIGIILNVECEVSSTLSLEENKFVTYNGELSNLHPVFAGLIDANKTLSNCAKNGSIVCNVVESTKYTYEGEGDEEIRQILQDKVQKATIFDVENGERSLNGAKITYKKVGNTYLNTSIIKIHRGIISRFAKSDFYSVLLEGLFPVYEPDDAIYNEKLFGFRMNEFGDLQNIIGTEDFMGLSLWLAKNRQLNATTTTKDSMIEVERSYDKKTALSRYDFKTPEAQAPYHYGSEIMDGSTLVNFGSEGTSRIEAMKLCNYAPIQIIASNTYERVWDKSYWDGDVDSRICNLMVLPHSEFGENLRKEFGFVIDGPSLVGADLGVGTSIITDWDKYDKEKHYGAIATLVRGKYITGDKDNVGKQKRDLFKVSKGNTRSMYILWRSQYGYQLMNIATPLDIELNQNDVELITVTPNGQSLQSKWDKDEAETYKVSDTHLRADHMLLCLLSQILITKKKNSNLLLNAPNISKLYNTLSFKTLGTISIPDIKDLVITLNGYDIEKILEYLLKNLIIKEEDVYIPQFIIEDSPNGTINCGGTISMSTTRGGLINLEELFYAEGLPYFSVVTPEQRVNIYPGVINKVLDKYYCQLLKDDYGLYKINKDIMKDGKFYKIFLPTIHSHTNKEGKKYYCRNYDTYKQILEGFAYNDVLLPLTRVLEYLGQLIDNLNSLEDLENPFFNLLYYNSIDLKFEMESSSLEEFVMQNTDCKCQIPVDYSHGFAFITLFGDLSRYLDASVYGRNVLNLNSFTGADINLGYTPSDYVKDIQGVDFRCCGHDIFGINRRAYRVRTLPEGSTLFKLGTKDWATSDSIQSELRRTTVVDDDNNKPSE